MPFDSLVRTVRLARDTTVLERLGLTPIPDDVLAAHKAKVAEEFFATSPTHRFDGSCRWIEFIRHGSCFVKPDNQTIFATSSTALCPIQHVKRFIESAVGIAAETPPVVMDIVYGTENRARAADIVTERVVGVFYYDPYVSLLYHEGGVIKRACLAIWDGPNVLKLATLR